jgi:hypothetical protein
MESGDDDVREEVLEGHSSRLRRFSDRWLLTLVVVLAVIAAGSIATAVHYRANAANAGKASTAAPAVPLQFRATGHFTRSLTVANSPFPIGFGQHGLLAIVHASVGDARPVVMVAQFAGLSAGLQYRLIGNDCQSNGHDFVWASGQASKAGTLLLATFPRALNPSHTYWMSFDRPGGTFPTGVVGMLGSGHVRPFRSGREPCAGES